MKTDGQMRDSLRITKLKDLDRVFAWLDGLGRRTGLDQATGEALRLGVEEALANIYQHGYAGCCGPVAIAFTAHPDRLEVELEDQAPVFDPCTLSPPNLEADWRKRKLGGLGWHLINQVMDGVEHVPCEPHGNILKLVKHR